MITRANILTEYPKIDQNILPKPFQKNEFDFIAENMEFADEDEDIGKFVDTFIMKLNEVISKSTSTKKAESSKNVVNKDADKPYNMTVMAKYKNEKFKAMDVAEGVQVNNLLHATLIKSDKLDELIAALKERQTEDWQFKIVKAGTSKILWQSDTVKEPQTKKAEAKKAQADKSGKTKKTEVPTIDQIPVEIALIKSYVNMHGKVKTKTQIYTFIKKVQKAITDKSVRKTSKYAEEIAFIQKHTILVFNNMKSGTKTFNIPDPHVNRLKNIAAVKLADHITVIRAFINILNNTKTGLMDKAKVLHAKIAKSKFDDSAKKSVSVIRTSLADYITGNADTIRINEFDLQGLYGLAGLSGLGELPADPQNTENKIFSASDFKNASFNLMNFMGKWLQLVGNPSVPFKMMVWGTGGSGKSTLAIEFAKYLAGTLNKRVLYVANEEGAGATLHEKMTRLNAFHTNLFITKTLPLRLVEYDFVFCDSANSMQMELPKFEQAAKLYPHLSWVLMFQTTKDGNFLGEKNWQHAVDVEVYCQNGKARALKSRFGGKEEVEIF